MIDLNFHEPAILFLLTIDIKLMPVLKDLYPEPPMQLGSAPWSLYQHSFGKDWEKAYMAYQSDAHYYDLGKKLSGLWM